MSKREVATAAAALARTNKPVKAMDGLKNLVAGLGTSQDKRMYNQYAIGRVLQQGELQNMYRDSWLAKRIVDSVADDMTRAWVTTSFDDNTPEAAMAIEKAEKRLDVQNKTNEALRWSRLFGGAVMILGVGRDKLDTPLDITKIKKGDLRYLHVLDRYRISASPTLCMNLDDPNFGMPLYYVMAESSIQIHYSRVLRFNGAKLPFFLWQQNGRWDDSVLQHTFQAISDSDQNSAAVGTMLFEANVDVITSNDLASMLSTDEGSKLVQERYQQTTMLKSYIRTLLLDGSEKYEKKSNSFANLDKIMEKFILNVCGSADIPATRLFGMSPAGMSATGESDTRNYYDRISASQETDLRHNLEYLYEIIVRSELGRLPDNFDIEFNPLWQISAVEQATIDKTRAETDQIYWNLGVVTEGAIAREAKERGIYPNLTDEEIALAEELAAAPPELDNATIPGTDPGVPPGEEDQTIQPQEQKE